MDISGANTCCICALMSGSHLHVLTRCACTGGHSQVSGSNRSFGEQLSMASASTLASSFAALSMSGLRAIEVSQVRAVLPHMQSGSVGRSGRPHGIKIVSVRGHPKLSCYNIFRLPRALHTGHHCAMSFAGAGDEHTKTSLVALRGMLSVSTLMSPFHHHLGDDQCENGKSIFKAVREVHILRIRSQFSCFLQSNLDR